MNYKSESVKSMEELVYILSVISLIFYSIVYVPQFYVIYKSKSSSGISIWTLLLWTQADIMSLIGTIVLYMHTSIIIVGWYHFIIGVCMIIFVLVYRKKYHSRVPDIKNDIEDNIAVDMADDNVDNNQPKYDIQLWCTVIFLLVNIIVCISLNLTIKKSNDVIGEILGWITTAFYITGRFPQMWLNYKNKSTEGLSVWMYVFTILGNASYIAVITIDPITIESNLPWIVSSAVMIVLDIYIIFQHFYYKTLSSIVLTSI